MTVQTKSVCRFYGRSGADFFAPSDDEKRKIESLNKQFAKIMNKASKKKKEMIEEILGELGEKYVVNLDYLAVKFDRMPFDIALGDRQGSEIKLDNWGSGTRNRTLILSLLIRARQLSADANATDRFAPIIFIEEPEAFLHPSAQSNFGRVIEDIAADSELQIIVSSHSPFLLSRRNPYSNMLLERKMRRNVSYETEIVETKDDNWMAPFAVSLGITKEELEPWQQVIASDAECTLVVEGDLDKSYIELYQNFTENKLPVGIRIIPIGGKDKLNDISMIRFITKFSKRVVFLLDLDAMDLEPKFNSAGLQKNSDFLFVGKDGGGRRKIEGLLPDEVHSKVYSGNHDLVMALQSNVNSEKKSAAGSLKQKLLEEFKVWCESGKKSPDFEKFSVLLNKCFAA